MSLIFGAGMLVKVLELKSLGCTALLSRVRVSNLVGLCELLSRCIVLETGGHASSQVISRMAP